MIITALKKTALIAIMTGAITTGAAYALDDVIVEWQEQAQIKTTLTKELASLEVSAQATAQAQQAQLTSLEIAQKELELTIKTQDARRENTRQEASLGHELNRESQLAWVWTGSKGIWYGLVGIVPCAVGGLIVWKVVQRQRIETEERKLVQVMANGAIPVSREFLLNEPAKVFEWATIRAEMDARVKLADAQKVAMPALATYSPTTSYAPATTYAPRNNYENTVTGIAQTHEVEEPTEAARVPTFAQLLRSGVIGRNQDAILYGFDDKQEQYKISFDKLTSTLIFGNSGSGKTTTLANLIGQLALNGFDLQIIDPHFGHDESLSERLKPLDIDHMRIAQTNEQIEKQARHMLTLLERAKATGEDVRTAWILDEVTAVLRNKCANVVQEALEAIAQEGRKYKLVAYAASQATRANRFGDSSVRDSFPIIALHRLRRSALRNVGLTSSDEFAKVEKLSVGVFMLDDGKSDPVFLTAPMVDQSDLLTISGSCQQVLPVLTRQSEVLPSGTAGTDSQTGTENHKEAQSGVNGESVDVGSNGEELRSDGDIERSEVVPNEALSFTAKECQAVLLAKETDISASEIHKRTGGNRAKILKLVRDAR